MLSNLKIRLYPEKDTCLICGKKTSLLKTDHKTCYSFDFGKFTLISGRGFCTNHKYFSSKPGQIIRYEPELAALIVDKNYQVTFDLVVKIGRLRYDDHRQLNEIQAYLKCSPARLDLPISTISVIAKRFLEFCRLLHQSLEDKIQGDIHENGGYFLHFDGSTEQKCGLSSLVLMDSRSGHVLESEMVESEKYETIKDALVRIQKKYGNPLAVISDLRGGFVNACKEVFGEDVVHILCHYHFLRTFKDEFNEDHLFIKTCMTNTWQLQAGLKKQLKALKETTPESGHPKELKILSEIEEYFKKTANVLGTYRYVLIWILNFKQASSGKGVPFDLPYLDLFHRFLDGKAVIDKIFVKATPYTRQKYYRHGFCPIVEKTKKLGVDEPGFRKATNQLEFAQKWFNKLRATLFLGANADNYEKTFAPLSKNYQLTEEEAKKIPVRLKDFIKALKKELLKYKNPNRISFLESLKGQIEKYQDNLRIPAIMTVIDGKETFLIPPRTNNILESLFRGVKSLLRRCSGRSKLPKEFGSVGALLPYYLTMREHKTFQEVFTNDQKLAEEFAKLFVTKLELPENIVSLRPKSKNQFKKPLLCVAQEA